MGSSLATVTLRGLSVGLVTYALWRSRRSVGFFCKVLVGTHP